MVILLSSKTHKTCKLQTLYLPWPSRYLCYVFTCMGTLINFLTAALQAAM